MCLPHRSRSWLGKIRPRKADALEAHAAESPVESSVAQCTCLLFTLSRLVDAPPRRRGSDTIRFHVCRTSPVQADR